MNTETITIGSLALIGTGFSILLTLKYITLKTYFRTEQSENAKLRDSNVEQQERINVLSKELDSKKKFITDLLQEDKRKNAKLLAKNQEIQQLKEQAIDFAEEFSMQHAYKGTATDYYHTIYKKK
jgi:predicted nuclease with TOPRIM domain